jgi:hypothetical protein
MLRLKNRGVTVGYSAGEKKNTRGNKNREKDFMLKPSGLEHRSDFSK